MFHAEDIYPETQRPARRTYTAPSPAIFMSHSANRREDPDWWIVEPREPGPRLAREVRSLLSAGRRVLKVIIHPLGGEVQELTDLPESMVNSHLWALENRR